MVEGVPLPCVLPDLFIGQRHLFMRRHIFRRVSKLRRLRPAERELRIRRKGCQLFFKPLRLCDVVGVHPRHQLIAASLKPGVQRLPKPHILRQRHGLPPGILFISVQNLIKLVRQRPVLHHHDLRRRNGLRENAVDALFQILRVFLPVNRKKNRKIHGSCLLSCKIPFLISEKREYPILL